MTLQEAAIKFIEKQQDLLYKTLPAHLVEEFFTEEDRQDVENMPSDKLCDFFKELSEMLEDDPEFIEDLHIWPFCFLHQPMSIGVQDIRTYRKRCSDCRYGKRHGVCYDVSSTQGKIYKHINICSFDGMVTMLKMHGLLETELFTYLNHLIKEIDNC